MVREVKVGDVIYWKDGPKVEGDTFPIRYLILEMHPKQGWNAVLTLQNVTEADMECGRIYKKHPTWFRDITIFKPAKKKVFK